MNVKLTALQVEILEQVFKDRDAAQWIAAIEHESLNPGQVEEACDLLSGEFHMNGIDQNFEATSYGKQIELLLDLVNRPRLHSR